MAQNDTLSRTIKDPMKQTLTPRGLAYSRDVEFEKGYSIYEQMASKQRLMKLTDFNPAPSSFATPKPNYPYNLYDYAYPLASNDFNETRRTGIRRSSNWDCATKDMRSTIPRSVLRSE